VVGAVDREAGGAEEVHPLISARPAGEPLRADQEISEEDEAGAGPAHDLDQDQFEAQAARFLST
jgi:hypothetical protein